MSLSFYTFCHANHIACCNGWTILAKSWWILYWCYPYQTIETNIICWFCISYIMLKPYGNLFSLNLTSKNKIKIMHWNMVIWVFSLIGLWFIWCLKLLNSFVFRKMIKLLDLFHICCYLYEAHHFIKQLFDLKMFSETRLPKIKTWHNLCRRSKSLRFLKCWHFTL